MWHRAPSQFKTQTHSSKTDLASAIFQHDNAVTSAVGSVSTDAEFDVSQSPKDRTKCYLFAEAIAFQFSLNYSHPLLKNEDQGEFDIFFFLMRGLFCEL